MSDYPRWPIEIDDDFVPEDDEETAAETLARWRLEEEMNKEHQRSGAGDFTPIELEFIRGSRLVVMGYPMGSPGHELEDIYARNAAFASAGMRNPYPLEWELATAAQIAAVESSNHG